MRILITGGAGFVGSALALQFRGRAPEHEIVALDNLRRRGSESNLEVLRNHGVGFVHGDIRMPSDFDELDGNFDLVIEASAEPSVHAGLSGSPSYVLQTNLTGTVHCLEFARRRAAGVIFLSTSRVYSIAALRALRLEEEGQRLRLIAEPATTGLSQAGISEAFSTDGARSFYGASKLGSEQVLQEYAAAYDVPSVINRCGVIVGPGQFGKLDQGVFSLWVAHHHFERPLCYTGFGARGLQVRDLLHPTDLFELIRAQAEQLADLRAERFNVGGGLDVSASLAEWTDLCREATGSEVPISADPETSSVDVPYYISDHGLVSRTFGWRPTRPARQIASETATWIREHEAALRPILVGGN